MKHYFQRTIVWLTPNLSTGTMEAWEKVRMASSIQKTHKAEKQVSYVEFNSQ